MSYATQQDMVDAFGEVEMVELTNLEDTNAQTIHSAVLTRSLDDASSLIDTYLQSRYTLPLPSIPRALVRPCADIARYYLDKTRQREDVRQRYEDALAFLKLLANGQVSLGLDETGESTNAIGGRPDFYKPNRVFSDEALQGF